MSDVIDFFPDLTNNDVEVRFHSEDEWNAIFADIHRRKGRPNPPPEVLATLLSNHIGGTSVVVNVDRVQEFCRAFNVPMTYYIVQTVIHELIHHIESPGGPGDRPKRNEEERVTKKAIELTDRLLETKAPEAFHRLAFAGISKGWYLNE